MWAIKTAKRSTTWLPTFTAAVRERLLIATMLQVLNQVFKSKPGGVVEMIKRELELHRLNTHSENRVQMAANRLCSHAFRYGGHIGTHLIVGGVDVKGPQLIECQNDGNAFSLPYHTTGSGSLAAMAILESYYKEDLSKEEAIQLVVTAIEAGIYHDLGSGSNVDVCVIMKGKVEYLRNLKHDNHKVFSKPGGYTFPKDRVHVIEEFKHLLVVEDSHVPMELI